MLRTNSSGRLTASEPARSWKKKACRMLRTRLPIPSEGVESPSRLAGIAIFTKVSSAIGRERGGSIRAVRHVRIEPDRRRDVRFSLRSLLRVGKAGVHG